VSCLLASYVCFGISICLFVIGIWNRGCGGICLSSFRSSCLIKAQKVDIAIIFVDTENQFINDFISLNINGRYIYFP
jgi:hypothetical protein